MTPAPIPHSRPWITADDITAVGSVLATEMIGAGPVLQQFETELAGWVRGEGAVAVSSGTAALTLALSALQAGPGDEVVLPTYVCPSVLDAVVSVGATPVLCDVGPGWVIDTDSVAPHLTPRTRAVIVPHVYGFRADVARLSYLGVPIVEDCAQALDRRGGQAVQGDIAVFSFHATKCLTTGEGGAAVSASPVLVDRMRRLRDGSGRPRQGRVAAPLSDMAAALGLSQLARYDDAVGHRARIARFYRERLLDAVPAVLDRQGAADTMWFRFPLSVPGGLDACAAAFAARGVTVRRGVDRLVHRLLGLEDAAFPVATELFRTTVCLPIYPALTDAEITRCADAACAILARTREVQCA